MICPCQRQQQNPLAYTDCCQPYHQGLPAPDVETLMRSRYSGYVLGLTDYVSLTWHPKTRPIDLNLSPDSQWKKLEIIKSSENQVHFKAYLQDEDNQFLCLEEISIFEQVDGLWCYLSGEVNTYPVILQRNDTCLCGSGKKFKKCCNR